MSRPDGSYDVIIIGAGIGGLVCGCYLAKAGMKVLIAERHSRPGGYCSSFSRKGYVFDAAAHCFGGYRKEGVTRAIFEELSLGGKVGVIQADPSNVVSTPDCRVRFWKDQERTIDEIQKVFPVEQNNLRSFLIFCSSRTPVRFLE